MQLKVGNKVAKVATLDEAVAKYEEWRGDKRASRMKDGQVTDDDGKFIARISYNGRLWPTEKYTLGEKAIITPGNLEREQRYGNLNAAAHP